MSHQSETTMTSTEEVDIELEDIIWNLMGRTGMLSEMKGQIAKFIQENGKVSNSNIYPERADAQILTLIYEYIQWIGMKNTSSLLLSESPAEIDTKVINPESGSDPNYRPALHHIWQNVSQDITDWKTQSQTSFDGASISRERQFSSILKLGYSKSSVGSVSSPTLNQTFTAGAKLDFGTPVSQKEPSFLIEREGEVDTSIDTTNLKNNVDKLGDGNLTPTLTRSEEQLIAEDLFMTDVLEKEHDMKYEKSTAFSRSANEAQSLAKPTDEGENKEDLAADTSKKSVSDDQFEEESISDFIDGLSLENNTEDISITSETKGMANCEHVVNLK